MNWYLIEVEKGQEESITEMLNHEEQFSAYFPKVQKHFRIHGEDSFGERALIAGCILLETDLSLKQVSDLFVHREIQIRSFEVLNDHDVLLLKRFFGNEWLMKMSRGVIVDGITKIIEGPLVGEEAHIKKINRHKRFCQLDYELNNHQLLAGLEIIEKR